MPDPGTAVPGGVRVGTRRLGGELAGGHAPADGPATGDDTGNTGLPNGSTVK